MSEAAHITATPSDSERPEQDYTVMAAHIAGAHGVTGNVRLRLVGTQHALTAQSLQAGRTVRAVGGPDAPERLLTLTSLRGGQAKGGWIAHFKEVTSRTEAETLLGYSLFIPETQRAPLPAGEYYVDELLGLTVETDTGHTLGQIADVLNTPANDVYVTDTDVMIPAVAEFILGVDLEQGKISVRDVPGLRDGT